MGKGLFGRLEGELEAREQSLGLRMADLLTLPEPLSRLMKWMIRQRQVSLADAATFLGEDEATARRLLAEALGKGYVREIELPSTTLYRVRLASKGRRELPTNLWQALESKVELGEEGGR